MSMASEETISGKTGSEETIVALATARGVAALAIVRMSGPEARAIANSCFPVIDVVSMPTRTLAVGLFSTATGEAVD